MGAVSSRVMPVISLVPEWVSPGHSAGGVLWAPSTLRPTVPHGLL